ncbi:MAG TPA: LPS assembly lipoprotein LptE [Thermoanaerobaculia bacterium]|nr:LPS assembly lipoprotein LptE [Thermoanaerobaculia bacterium]
MIARRCTAALLGASCLILSGCGYALVGRGSNLPEDIREVYIRPLENRTPRSQVEQELTRAIAEELVQRQRFAVVGNAEEADAELSGAVVFYGATPITFDAEGRATEYEIAITAQIVFKRTGPGAPGTGTAPSPAAVVAPADPAAPATPGATTPPAGAAGTPGAPAVDPSIIWSNDRYTFRETYEIAADANYVDLEDEAIQEAAERFAETMVSDLLEGF